MMRHLSANLWLLLLTLALCSVAYPLTLLAIAQVPFLKDQAEGSLLRDRDADGNVIIVGSRLEAQAFDGDEYFWPRPSAVSYKANASGGSNLSANNPDLRSQVENRLGAVLKYGPKSPKKGQLIGPDIDKWFLEWAKKNPAQAEKDGGLLAQWAEKNSGLAQAWAKESKLNTDHLDMWKKTDEAERWCKGKLEADPASLKAEEVAVEYLKFFSYSHPGKWPIVTQVEKIHPDTGVKFKVLEAERASSGKEIRNNFYTMWREAHPEITNDLFEPVPADMVTTSGSGLDPHITMKSARYQFERVADAWARKRNLPRSQIDPRLLQLLDSHNKHAPLGGIAGVEMVNVMDLNFALKKNAW